MTSLGKFRLCIPTDIDPPFSIPVFQINWVGTLIAFDQTLSNTGWVVLRVDDNIEVIETGMIKTHSDAKGHEANLLRSQSVYSQVNEILKFINPSLVVHELPPVGGQMMRPESSLLAALAIRIAAANHSIPTKMIGAQRVKKRLTEDAKASKAAVKEVVRGQLPEIKTFKPLNEHVYDAAGLGLVAIEEGLK